MLVARRRLAGGDALVLLLAVITAATTRVAVADDFFSPLSPLLSPVINSLCNAVACGKGNCTVTSGLPGYRCECEPGWTQMHVGDEFRFLPCVIPNCSIDRTCSSNASAPAPAPLPPPKNFSLSDPCELAYCGAGGTCKNGTGLSYHCACKEGFSNLLNITTMPCFQDCRIKNAQAISLLHSKLVHRVLTLCIISGSIGADCTSIGILPFSNSSRSPAPSGSARLSNNGNAPAQGSFSQVLLPLLILASLAMVQAI